MESLGSNFLETIDKFSPKSRSSVKGSDSGFSWMENFGSKIVEFGESVDKTARTIKTNFLLVLVVFSFLLLFSRLFTLQVIKGKEYLASSEENRVRIQIQRASRGLITDRHDKVIARNKPGFSVAYVTGADRDIGEIRELSKILDISTDEILEKIGKAAAAGLPQATIVSGLSRDEAVRIEPEILNLKEATLEISPIREYLDSYSFSHLVGYVSEMNAEELSKLGDRGYISGDKIGKTGIEKAYEAVLHGKNGGRVYEVDASSSSFKIISEKRAERGEKVVLTIDYDLQTNSYEALRRGVERSGATGGAVVAQSAGNGEVLAMVSYPSFDANKFVAGISSEEFQDILESPGKPLFNRAISAQYPPGSTFKMITATAALEEGIVSPEQEIEAPGSISIGEFVYNDWKPEGHGIVNLYQALGKSADTYFYKIGGGYGDQKGVGVKGLYKWSKLYGLGDITGIDIEGESAGLIPNEEWKLKVKGEPWYLGNTYHFAIGQGDVLTTPLQLNNVIVAIANGGTLYQPALLKGSGGGRIIRTDFVSSETLEAVKLGMKMACDPGGTAYPLYDLPEIEVGCKTGTSEFGIASSDKTHAWITLFAPYDNPQVVLTVFLEGGGEGSRDAGSVMREIMDWLISERKELLNIY